MIRKYAFICTHFLVGLNLSNVFATGESVRITSGQNPWVYKDSDPYISFTTTGEVCPSRPAIESIQAVLDGGVQSGGFTSGASGPTGTDEMRAHIATSLFANKLCQHTLTVEGYMHTSTACDGSDLVYVKSNPLTIWIDDTTTMPQEGTMAMCNGGCPSCNVTSVGNPVDVTSGRMFHEMVDLKINGPLPIEFIRRYDSQSTANGALGFGWQHAYMMRLENVSNQNTQVFDDKQMRRIFFNCSNYSSGSCQDAWYENINEHLTLTKGSNPPWRVEDKHTMHYDFDGSGKLLAIQDRNGNTITCGYTSGKLTSISDSFGRSISLSYDMSNHLASISAGSRTVTYTYTGDHLTRVDFPDSTFVTYAYSGDNLTEVKDSAGKVVEAHTYDSSDRVTDTESEGGNLAYHLEFDSPSANKTTVTNSLGADTVYTFNPYMGLVTDRTGGPGCSSCGESGSEAHYIFDDVGNLIERVDGNGVSTEITYDDQGNVLTRTEAVGEAVERTWTYTYNPTFNRVATISIPSVGSCSNANKIITNTYDSGTGDLTQEQVVGCNGSAAFTFTTSYTYDSHGQVETINGPRTDVTDVTTYEYFSDSDSIVNRRARLMRVTNALGHETEYSQVSGFDYDVFGNLGSTTDPNGVNTVYTYDAGDRVTESRIKGPTSGDDIVTTNEYDDVGRLFRVRLPNCVDAGMGCSFSLERIYVDGVGWLKEMHDAVGNKVVNSYDTEGNRTREEYLDSLDAVTRFTNFAYDSFNRLRYTYFNDIPPDPEGDGTEDTASIFAKISYDGEGNVVTELDPDGHTITYTFDELNRLKSSSQVAGADTLLTAYAYDGLDSVASLTDPRSLVTTYQNSDMGWRLSAVAPDSGTITYSYDPAGNLVSLANANGTTVGRTYDALNRPLVTSYPTTSLNVTFSYDSLGVTFGIGHRTAMTDPSGSSVYHYDRRGHLIEEVKTLSAVEYTIQYGYDKTGNRTQVLYPADHPLRRQGEAVYTYDAANRVVEVAASVNGSMTTVATDIAYQPYGPRSHITFGNSLSDDRSYDSRYQIEDWTLGSLLDYTHLFNDDGNLISRTDNLDSANDRSFGYDGAHRLTQASGPWGAGTYCTGGATYTYDKNGNRLCKGEVSSSTSYSYSSGTNRLSSASGAESASYSHDSNGNTTSDGSNSYEYNDADRLETVDSGSTATYTYDGDGRRVIKSASGVTTYYFFDPAGLLLTETVPADENGKDYLYLDAAPVGRVDWSPTEQSIGAVLRCVSASPNVDLDWSLYSASDNKYIIRRKHVTDPGELTFGGNIVLDTVEDPTQTYADAVLADGNFYEYEVSKRTFSDSLIFYHADHLGTPVALSDDGASLVWRIEPFPFGGDWTVTGSGSNNLAFPGQYRDGESGLSQNWYRDYDPGAGRYQEVDPIDIQDGVSPFTYALNAPQTLIDPMGWKPQTRSRCDVSRNCPQSVKDGVRDACIGGRSHPWGYVRRCVKSACARSLNVECYDQKSMKECDQVGNHVPVFSISTQLIGVCANIPLTRPGSCYKKVFIHEFADHQCSPRGLQTYPDEEHMRRIEDIRRTTTCP